MLVLSYKTTLAAQHQKSHIGLGVCSLQTQKYLAHHGVDVESWGVIDGYDLRNRLRCSSFVKTVVLQAPFFDTNFLKSLCVEFPKILFTVLCHSNTGFLAADPWSTRMVREHIHLEDEVGNFVVSGNSWRYCDAIKNAFKRPCLYLPNLYPLLPIQDRICRVSEPIRIGVFGATRIQKNQFNAVWAAIEVGQRLRKRVEITINSGREEGGKGVAGSIEALVEGLPGVCLKKAGWLTHSNFKNLVGHQDILISPSYTESHNIVTCDAADEGVPSVVGPSVAWLPSKFHCEPDDVHSIADTTIRLLHDKRAPKQAWKYLDSFNRDGVGYWLKFLRHKS